MDFACDIGSDDALRVAEEERNFLDQSFFVLLFGVLERQINQLAMARLPSQERRTAMRSAKFENRLDAATKVASEIVGTERANSITSARGKILEWYETRSDIAHGEALTTLVDIAGLLQQAKVISTLFDEVQAALSTEAT
jgi:hypothetical protein